MRLEDLLEQHGAFSLEKQDALVDLLGEHNWWLDIPAGTVDFGQGRIYPIQLLGTESSADQSWLWAWANDGSNIPEPLLRCANQLREFGRREHVHTFVAAELKLDTVNSHTLGLVATGITGADAYYLGHHNAGAVLFLISASELRRVRARSVLRMTRIFSTFISGWNVANQQRAFIAYAEAKGCEITVNGSHVACVNPVGEELHGDFNEQGLLVSLNSKTQSRGTI